MMKDRNIRKISIVILMLFTVITNSCSLFRKQKTPDLVITPLSDTIIMRSGSLIYALPMTVFTVSVQMERTIELPGPYAKYAGELLGLTDVIMQEDEHWEIKDITVSSHEEVDPSEFYVIESSTLQQTNALALKKSGLIMDLNPGLNVPVVAGSAGKEFNINDFRSFDLGADEYFRVNTDTAYKRARVDGQFIRIPYVVEKNTRLTSGELAQRAAKRLMELREGKLMVLTGEANVYPQDASSINELNRLEKEYTDLFTGKIITQTRSFNYQVIPTPEMSGRQVRLFNFSEVTGPESESTSNGIPVMMEMNPEKKTKDVTIISSQKGDTGKVLPDKLYYRIPDVADLRIKIGDDVLYNSRRLVYQFGQIVQLPSNYIIGK
ncbi:MAG: DUF4831 family protein [Bacteroidales bacterium]|jgi:hypothetical protein|nr:DUF4831 family protein [Bacteroidales bacterium]NMD02556.1 DUF4831 family protein [Bacteroidales bacterium]OQB64847.1 MAG: hypothetical protein BWX96_00343 [Bacteroidetes bacterium ADurb.Bin145]HOU02047.1 DUF4831 family protein [Bacteroidales bacterium]HQK66805.1 DUF4831 family protein [Bacteroidales bacterium]